MAAITIRQLPDATKQALRERAAANGRSMEAEARAILTEAVEPDYRAVNNAFVDAAQRVGVLFAEAGWTLEIPPRGETGPGVDFRGPEWDPR